MSQMFSHRSESSELHVRLPSLRVWHQEEKPTEHLAMKTSWTRVQELQRTGRNRDFTLGGHKQGFTCTGTKHKAVTP